MTKKNIREDTCEIVESIPGETILQFLSRVFGITYDKTMQEIDNGTVAKANKASNAKINRGFHKDVKYMTESSEISKDDYDKFDRESAIKNIEKDFITQRSEIREDICKAFKLPNMYFQNSMDKWFIFYYKDSTIVSYPNKKIPRSISYFF